MNERSVYDPQTGRILYWTSTEQMDFLGEQGVFVEGHHPAERLYMVDGQPTERPTQSTQLTGLTLADVPANATLHIDGQSYPLTDTTVDLDFPLPGTYRLRVECWPYLDWTGEVTV